MLKFTKTAALIRQITSQLITTLKPSGFIGIRKVSCEGILLKRHELSFQ